MRKWHISLSSWLKDYIYIPLGGNRKGMFRTSVNTILTFIASGIWHGANWTFALWGVVNGIGMAIEKMFLKDLPKSRLIKICSFIKVQHIAGKSRLN